MVRKTEFARGLMMILALTAGPSTLTAVTAQADGGASAGGPVGDSCKSSDPNKICLGLKYVVYNDPSSKKPVVDQNAAAATVKDINKEWAKCNIAFQIDEYDAVNPADHGLDFHTANNADLDKIRNAFDNANEMLVVTTGDWDRSGSLGGSGANAWTAMPGATPYGTILEANVGTFGNIIAHELGHYMSLDHVSDDANLMNPLIYQGDLKITPDQCNQARQAVGQYWGAIKR